MQSRPRIEINFDATQIGSVVGVLRGVIICYIKKEFSKYFPYVDKVQHSTLNDTVIQLFEEEMITKALKSYLSEGTMKARMTYARDFFSTAVSYVDSSRAPLKVWRIEHIKYFTQKAEFLSITLNQLCSNRPLNPKLISQIVNELSELIKSINALASTRNDRGVLVSVGNNTTSVQGMLGSNDKSSLINDIQAQLAIIDIDQTTKQLKQLCTELTKKQNGSTPKPSGLNNQTLFSDKKNGQVADEKPAEKKSATSVVAAPESTSTPAAPQEPNHTESVKKKTPNKKPSEVSAQQDSNHAKNLDDYDKEGLTAVHRAIQTQDLAQLRQLLQDGASVSKCVLERGFSPLFLAVHQAKTQHDHAPYQIIAELLAHKADVNEIISLPMNASDSATVKCNLLHYLLFNESSKGPQARNLNKKPNTRVIELLLEHNIDTQAIPKSDPKDVACKNLQWYTHELEEQECRNKNAHLELIGLIKSAQPKRNNPI